MYPVLLQQKSDLIHHVLDKLTLNHTKELQKKHDLDGRPLIPQCSTSEWIDPLKRITNPHSRPTLCS